VNFLFDTNVVSETARRRPSAKVVSWLAQQPQDAAAISVVTMAELVEGASAATDTARRNQLRRWLDETVVPWFNDQVLPLTQDVLVDWLILSRKLAVRGISRTAPDLLIAATDRVGDLTVVTRNVRDFADTGVVVYDPWNDQTHRMDAP
jgi:predicted nucleic acid-binding protein